MILKIFGSQFESDSQPATGTYADGLYPALAAKELESERERHFRESYARDYSLVRKLENQPLSFS